MIYNRRIDKDNIVIRRMTDTDLESVMRIWLESNIKAHNFIPVSYWQSQYETVKPLIADAEVYVCEKYDKIVGFIGLSANYIAGIFVDADFQSQGIGKKLLDYVKAMNYELHLHVYEKNCRAIKFYQRENFEICAADIDENTGEKELLMTFEFSGTY